MLLDMQERNNKMNNKNFEVYSYRNEPRKKTFKETHPELYSDKHNIIELKILDVLWLKSLITKSKTVEISKKKLEQHFGIRKMINETFVQKMDNLISAIKVYDENGEF